MENDTAMLTQMQGFEAMFCFLEAYWKQTGSTEIAGLLGSLCIQPDGKPADAAMWNDWVTCCGLVKNCA